MKDAQLYYQDPGVHKLKAYPLLENTNGVPLKLATALVVPSESNSSLERMKC